MNNYEEKALALDKELAELLGWHRLYKSDFFGDYLRFKGDNPSLSIVNDWIPRWTQDDAFAFRLMVEHEIETYWEIDAICCYDPDNEFKYARAKFSEFLDKQSAVLSLLDVLLGL